MDRSECVLIHEAIVLMFMRGARSSASRSSTFEGLERYARRTTRKRTPLTFPLGRQARNGWCKRRQVSRHPRASSGQYRGSVQRHGRLVSQLSCSSSLRNLPTEPCVHSFDAYPQVGKVDPEACESNTPLSTIFPHRTL